ncbi:MAG: cell division protein ZapA [bacterium]
MSAMSEFSQKTTIEVLGEEYAIKSDIPPKEVRRLAGYVNTKMEGIRHKAKGIPSLTVAVLACLNIAEELFAVRRQLEETQNLMEEEATNILKLLDEFFSSANEY